MFDSSTKTLSATDKAIQWNVDNERISIDFDMGVIYGASGKALKPSPNGRGYFSVGLQKERGGQIAAYIHRIIAYAVWKDALFVNHVEVNHINEVKSDNRLANLELLTSSQNKYHSSYRHIGKHNNKLTEDDVRQIRVLRAGGKRLLDIASQYGICESLVSQIARGVRWQRVK